MRFKKIISGLLVGALAVTSVFTGNVTTAKAEVTAEAPKYSFDFNAESLDSTVSPDDALTVVEAGNAASTAAPVYETGRSGEAGDKSVKLGSYALSLPGNIGENYTVNVWMKSNVDTIANNNAIFLLGAGDPNQEWLGFAGNGTEGKARVWGKYSGAYQEVVSNINMAKDRWTMLTIAQEGAAMEIYQDGVLKATKNDVSSILKGDDRNILLGTTYWSADGTFNGWLDDVQIYDKKLTANQIYKMFDPRTEKDVFAEGKLTVSEQIKMLLGGATATVTATPPSGVDAAKITYSYASANAAIASVDAATGVITAKAAGTTTITTTAIYDGDEATAKTAKTTVIVRDPNVKEEGVVVDYDLSQAVNGKLIDITGNGNDATLHGEKYSFENGALKLDGSKSSTANQTYVDLPLSIMDKLTSKEKFTIQVKFAKTADVFMAWLFCFGSNPQSTGTNYMFLSPNFQNTQLRAGIKDSTTEKLFATSLVPERNKFYTVNMVFDQGKIRLYWNGVMIKGDNGDELDSGYNMMDDIVTPGCKDNILGYIGKSCWGQDEYFKGLISEFKIYDKAMTNEDVQLSDPAYQREFEAEVRKELTVDKILGKNDSKDEIKYNLSLPDHINEVSVTWKSSNKDVISDDGIVKCKDTEQNVTMTGTAKSGALQAEISFDLKVMLLDRTALDAALAEANTAKNAANFKYYTEESKNNLTQLLDKGANVANQEEADSLTKNIKNAIAKLTFAEAYIDPFAKIDKTKFKDFTVTPKGTSNVLSSVIPADVKPYVTVEYTSSKPGVATVDKNTGIVKGVKLGYTIITTKVKAASDGFEMEYQTIVKVDLNIKGVSVKAKKTTLAKGEKTDITITYPAAVRAAGATATYRATGAVSVSKGKVTAKKAGTGTVIVKVKAGGKTITKKLKFKVGEITGDSKVKIKKSITLKVTGISGKVTWSLDKKGKKLASISKKGKLTAKKKTGKVTVTAKVGKVTMKKTITIKKK